MLETREAESRVIVVTPIGRDAKLVTDLLFRSTLHCLECKSLADACDRIREGAGVAIVAEEALNNRLVEELASVLREQPPWSDFPLILLTFAGEVSARSQRRRALREPLGNVLLLERPVRPETLISTVQNALRARKRQYEIRDRLQEYRMAQEALRKSEKLAVAGRLAASIAHEINNPLESVTNLLYLLRTSEPAQYPQYLEQAESELARVTEITKQTLRFYREPATPSPVGVAEIVESVLALHRARLQGSSVEVRLEMEAKNQILAAKGELRQVLSNLITNALDAMRNGGRLTIRAKDASDVADGMRRGVRLSVADTGSGIPADILKHVFEPFVSTKGDTGTGLGLWVTAEIVRKLSGRIRVRSRTADDVKNSSEHSGTVFSVFWPGIPEQS